MDICCFVFSFSGVEDHCSVSFGSVIFCDLEILSCPFKMTSSALVLSCGTDKVRLLEKDLDSEAIAVAKLSSIH